MAAMRSRTRRKFYIKALEEHVNALLKEADVLRSATTHTYPLHIKIVASDKQYSLK